LIVVELKTVVRLDRVHVGQLISYLKTTGLRGGLLINFRNFVRFVLRRGATFVVMTDPTNQI
jgi:GxxExxY protein